jgi:LytS/YehU family sensor histidine kinase
MKHQSTILKFVVHLAGIIILFLINIKIHVSVEKIFNIYYFNFTLLKILVFYGSYFLMFNWLLRKKKYILWLLGEGLVLLGAVFVRYTVEEVIMASITGRHNYYAGTPITYYVADNVKFLLPFLLLGIVVRLIQEWLRNQQEKASLENIAVKAELSFLKSQLNPHFLFNNLNNICSLIQRNPQKATESVLLMSEMMRYMLYDGNKGLVPLNREVAYIENYVRFERIRYKENVNIEFRTEGDPDGCWIEPLLLSTIVENAFKHGVVTEKDSPVSIVLKVRNHRTIVFDVRNRIRNQQAEKEGGFGLSILKRRLDLTHPGGYELSTSVEKDIFHASLYLKLNSE